MKFRKFCYIFPFVLGIITSAKFNLSSENKFSSKQLLQTVAAILSAAPIFFASAPILAVDNRNPSENIRKVFSGLPGYGTSDVYYPNIYRGEWVVDQEVTDIIWTEKDGTKVPKSRIIQAYVNTFKSNDKHLIYNRIYDDYKGNIILNRGASEKHFVNTVIKDEDDVSFDASFDPSNPNSVDLRSSKGNDEIQILVTKRSIEDMNGNVVNGKEMTPVVVPRKEEAIGYSEFSMILDESKGQSNVFATRLLARYKVLTDNEIKGVERLYIYDADLLDLGDKPLGIIKSKITMNRVVAKLF